MLGAPRDPMAKVVIENLVKTYPEKTGPGVRAVNGISLTVEDREFMVLVGPSGCGKSTTLRMIAGLEEITAGTIRIGDRVVNDVLPKDRDIAMVFQNYALYPHLSVYDNLAFGLRLRKFAKGEIETRVREAAALLGLEPYLERKPKALSGGQRQRVAVGRAIVRKPQVFLFDEPLSNLDAKMRVSMRLELTRLRARLQATMIYVTHDQVEAMTMGDRICVMKDGDIVQIARPLELYNRPQTMFVGGFIGSPPMNFFRGTLEPEGDRVWFAESGEGAAGLRLALPPALAARGAQRPDRRVVLGIRPEQVHAAAALPGAEPGARATVKTELFEPMGAEAFLHVHSGRTPFILRVVAASRFVPGQPAEVAFDLEQAHLFDPQTERVLPPAAG
jgi:multiple sugar transport system ATP-binding protein